MNDPQPGPPPSASAEGQFLQHMSGSEIRAYRAWLDLPWSRLAPEQHTTLAALSKRFPGFIELQNGGTHTGEPFTPRSVLFLFLFLSLLTYPWDRCSSRMLA